MVTLYSKTDYIKSSMLSESPTPDKYKVGARICGMYHVDRN
jgi:hypothetical protein